MKQVVSSTLDLSLRIRCSQTGYALILTTMNELGGLRAIWGSIPIELFEEVIVVDGHSTDGTLDFLRSKRIQVMEQSRTGRGNAIREAIDNARSEVIVLMASDGNDDPRYIGSILSKLEEGYDLVAGSRFMKGGRTDDSDDPFGLRRFGNGLFTALVNLLWGSCLTDSTYSLRAFRKASWNKMRIAAERNETEFLMSIRAAKMKLKVAEIPTVENKRVGGVVKARSMPTGLSFLRTILSEIVK